MIDQTRPSITGSIRSEWNVTWESADIGFVNVVEIVGSAAVTRCANAGSQEGTRRPSAGNTAAAAIAETQTRCRSAADRLFKTEVIQNAKRRTTVALIIGSSLLSWHPRLSPKSS